MRLALSILATLLAISSVAAVPFVERRDVELPEGAYWEGNNLVLAKDYADDSEDSDEEEASPQASDMLAAHDDTFNATSLTNEKRDFMPGKYVVDIRVGPAPSHSGTLRKWRMWKAIYDCMHVIAEPFKDTDRELCSVTEFPHGGPGACPAQCIIPNIVYNAEPHDKYASGAHMVVTASWVELHEKAHPGIRDVAYRLIADIYRLMTEQESNCYYIDFPNSRKTKMCNVGAEVMIAFPTNGGPIIGIIHVTVTFNGKTKEGTFNNNGNMTCAIAGHFQKHTEPELSKVLGWPEEKMYVYVTGQKTPECMGVHKDYKYGDTWLYRTGCPNGNGQIC